MSIVTMKRKSHATHFKISHNKDFNLNGNRHQRSSSFVGGSSSFANSTVRTPFKGAHPRGHGTCCGKYNGNVINSHYCSTAPVSNVGKKSVKNTKGYLSRKNVWLTGGYPKFVVQPQSKSDYKTYYEKITNCNGCKHYQTNDAGDACSNPSSSSNKNCNTSNLPGNMKLPGRKLNVQNYQKTMEPMSQGTYIESHHKCNKCLPPPASKREFPMAINNNGCNVKITSHQQAIDMGMYN